MNTWMGHSADFSVNGVDDSFENGKHFVDSDEWLVEESQEPANWFEFDLNQEAELATVSTEAAA